MNPLLKLRNRLEEAVEKKDTDFIRQCLSGKYLPVLGGNEQPADIILQALSVPSFGPEWSNRLTNLLVGLINERVEISGNIPDDNLYVYNLFLFASYLPRNPGLFLSLKNCYQTGLEINEYDKIRRQLRQALTFQQTDQSFGETWMSYFKNISPNTVELSREQRGELLDAWQGLLWIPPTAEERRVGQVVSMKRVDGGLKALYKAVYRTTDDVNILRYAIHLLDDSYPRSSGFWVKCFSDYIHDYPALLCDALVCQWPMLDNDKFEDISTLLSKELQSIWKLFTTEKQAEINKVIAELDSSQWARFWENYFIEQAPESVSVQEWRMKLNEIKKVVEKQYSQLSPREENLEYLQDFTHDSAVSKRKEKTKKGKGLGIDRLAAKDRANKVVTEIDKLLLKGNLEKAKSYLDDIINKQKKEGTESEYIAKTLCNVATIAKERGYFDWSEEVYILAQEESPDDVVAHNGLAETLKAQDKLKEAEELYRQNITRWPDNVVAHNGLAETLKAQDKLKEADELYKQNITRWPDNVVANTGLAETLKTQDKLNEAEELYRQIITRWPDDVVAHSGLADTLKAQDKLNEAEELYRQNITQWPDNVVVHNGLAETLKAQGKLKEAEELYRQNITRWPDNVVVHNGLAEILKAQDKLKEAEELYKQNITRWSGDVIAHTGLAETLKTQDKLKEAEELYRQNITRWTDDVVVHTGLAETLKAQDKLKEAEELYKQNITRWPDNVVAHTGLAETLKAQDKLKEAEELYRQNITRWPDNVVVHSGLAETLKAQDKLKEAEELYRQNITRWTNDVIAHNGLAETLKTQGKLKEAEELYRQNITRWPDNPIVKHGLSNVLRKLKRYEEALSLIPETTFFNSIHKQYDAHLRCMILLEQGDVESAKTIVMTALKSNLSPRRSRIFEATRIAVELKEKNFKAALEDLNTIPESPATNVFRLHAHAGAMHTNEASQMYDQLSSTDLRIPEPVRFAAQKIGQRYFQKDVEELKVPTNEEFDEIIRAEIDMILALAA